jgi:hypothetical protein
MTFEDSGDGRVMTVTGAAKGAPPAAMPGAMTIGSNVRPDPDGDGPTLAAFARAPTGAAPEHGDDEFETIWRALLRLSDPVGVTPAALAVDLGLMLTDAQQLIDRLEAIGLVVRRAQLGLDWAFLTPAAARLVAMIAKSADRADGPVLALFDEGAPGRTLAMPVAISEWLVAALA